MQTLLAHDVHQDFLTSSQTLCHWSPPFCVQLPHHFLCSVLTRPTRGLPAKLRYPPFSSRQQRPHLQVEDTCPQNNTSIKETCNKKTLPEFGKIKMDPSQSFPGKNITTKTLSTTASFLLPQWHSGIHFVLLLQTRVSCIRNVTVYNAAQQSFKVFKSHNNICPTTHCYRLGVSPFKGELVRQCLHIQQKEKGKKMKI